MNPYGLHFVDCGEYTPFRPALTMEKGDITDLLDCLGSILESAS